MNLKQVEYLVAVVENGSFSLAAKACFVTVQAVSKGIADLEHELGQELFVRQSRGVKPTEFGLAFYEKAKEALVAFKELENLPAAFESSVENLGTLRLALYAPRFHNNEFVCASIGRFFAGRLGVKVEVPLLNGTEAIKQLHERAIDAFISIGTFSRPDTDCTPIGTLPTGVIMGLNHPLVEKDEVTLADIDAYPVIESSEFDTFNASVLNVYRKRGLKSPVIEPHSTEEYLALVNERNALSFAVNIPSFSIAFPGTTARRIAAADANPIPICLISPKEGKTKAYLAAERLLREGMHPNPEGAEP